MTEKENQEVSTDQELERVREALKNANAEAARNRVKASDLETQLAEAKKAGDRFRQSYVTSKAASVLSSLGVSNTNVSKFLDFDKIDVSESGELVGLDEQITELQTTLPELFDAKRRAPKIDAADKPKAKVQLTSAQVMLKNAQS